MINKYIKILHIIILLTLACIFTPNIQAKSFNKEKTTLQITARALIVEDKKLLLVSDNGHFWYTPGGKLEGSETLVKCIIRELMEETGLTVKPQQILFVEEFVDKKSQLHKVEIYFTTVVESGQISFNCKDKGGLVKFAKFFSIEEIKNMDNIAPEFLKDGVWENLIQNPYKGMRIK